MTRREARLFLAIAILLGALGATPAAAQKSRLPPSLDVWKRVDWKQADARNLESLVGQQAALLREYGSVRSEQGTYRREAAQWQVTLHELQDRSGAYGAFTLLGRGGESVSLGEGGTRKGDGFLFYQGNYLVAAQGEVGLSELRSLAQHLEAQAGRQASLPSLPFYLPQEGLLRGSDRYVLGPLALAQVSPLAAGDWVGFAYGAEVEAARYRVGDREATLLLITYPTPQIVRDRLDDFHRLFNFNGLGDPWQPRVYCRRSGTFLALVAGLESADAAAELIERVRYETKVSWSDPTDPRPPPSWAKTLLNIFLGTGLFLLFALLSGIAYALFRLLVKRLFPGKVFDRPEDTEIITLNLEGRG